MILATKPGPAREVGSDSRVDRFREAKRSWWVEMTGRVLAVALMVAAIPSANAWEKGDVLNAIHQVENPRDTVRVGRRGELGPFQFRPVVWYRYTEKPFMLAADAAEAQVVAEAHYEWIKRGLERNGLQVTPYSIGLVWNAGLQATVNNRASNQSKQYAQRVANLVEYSEGAKNAAAPDQPKPPSS